MNDIELRDYFAAHCPKKFRSKVDYGTLIEFFKLPGRIECVQDHHWIEYDVVQRYKYADQMMNQRS